MPSAKPSCFSPLSGLFQFQNRCRVAFASVRGGDWENSQITPVLPFSPPPGMRRRPLQNAKVCKQPATSIQQPVSSSQYQGRRGHLRWELDIDRLHICTLAHFRAKRRPASQVARSANGQLPIPMKCDRHWILAAGCWILPHLNMSRKSRFRFWEKRSGGDWENSQINSRSPFLPSPGMRRRQRGVVFNAEPQRRREAERCAVKMGNNLNNL